MELLFLGTSSGTPTKSRNVTALALRERGARSWLLVDCGEGTQHRILHTNLSLVALRAIFVTHIHGDHCYGLPGLLASAGMMNRSAPLLIIGPAAIRTFVEGVLASTQMALPYALEFIAVEETPAISALPDFEVRATLLSHRVPSYGYTFTEKAVEGRLDIDRLRADGVPAGPEWGLIQQGRDVVLADGRTVRAADYQLQPRKPRRVIVGGDNDTPSLLAEEARTAEVLVHEATYTEDVLAKVGPAPQHSSAHSVAAFARKAGVPNLVLTHFSSRYQAEGKVSIADVENEARAAYDGRLFLANDLELYWLDKQGVLAKVAQA
jgi:ribonuclease Z